MKLQKQVLIKIVLSEKPGTLFIVNKYDNYYNADPIKKNLSHLQKSNEFISPENKPMRASDSGRDLDLDIARAVAIISIVIGHIPYYFERYDVRHFSKSFGILLQQTVYSYHIATFMLIAGIVLNYSWSSVTNIKDYINFIRKKFIRIMFPYLTISILMLLVKEILPISSMFDSKTFLIHIFIAPQGGSAGHLWFLYCLMSIYLVWPIFSTCGLFSKRILPMTITFMLALAIIPIPWPTTGGNLYLFGLKDFMWYLPIFSIGFFCRPNKLPYKHFGLKAILASGCVFVVCLLLKRQTFWTSDFLSVILRNANNMLCAIAGSLFVLWLSKLISLYKNRFRSVLTFIGERSYDIYLLHVLLAGHPAAYLISKLEVSIATTYLMFTAAIILSVIIPILAGACIRRSSLLACYLLGISLKK